MIIRQSKKRVARDSALEYVIPQEDFLKLHKEAQKQGQDDVVRQIVDIMYEMEKRLQIDNDLKYAINRTRNLLHGNTWRDPGTLRNQVAKIADHLGINKLKFF